jgi:hypothetical protein
MSLPPKGAYPTLAAAMEAAQSYTRGAGYAFNIRRSEKENSRVKKLLLCSRGGRYRPTINEKHRKRQRATVKTNYKFSVVIKERPRRMWTLAHRPDPANRVHNHKAFTDPGACHQHRRLTAEQITVVKTNFNVSISTRQTVTALRSADPNVLLIKRDIYNLTSQLTRARRRGVAAPAALIRTLEEERDSSNIYFKVEYYKDRSIKNLSIVDQRSVEYLHKHPNALLGDNTYKTNKFGMPY